MIKTYKQAVITVDENVWTFVYDTDSKKILMEPQQCSGTYTCSQTLVIADSLEECEEYIETNAITNSLYDDVTADFIQ
jgi:molybdopterin biosynthesis enzyme MoaB